MFLPLLPHPPRLRGWALADDAGAPGADDVQEGGEVATFGRKLQVCPLLGDVFWCSL